MTSPESGVEDMGQPIKGEDMTSWFHAPRTAIWLLPLTCLLAALALTASGSAATSRTDPVNALVVGTVRGCGGIPTGGRVQCTLERRAAVSAFTTNRRLVASESITNGHFSFALRPGKYVLRSKYGGYRATRRVTAKANRTVHTNLSFSRK